jgi:hypothetical protein
VIKGQLQMAEAGWAEPTARPASAEALSSFQATMGRLGLRVYECGLRSSGCHGLPLWRVCFGGGRPDVFICKGCQRRCEPIF